MIPTCSIMIRMAHDNSKMQEEFGDFQGWVMIDLPNFFMDVQIPKSPHRY
jgi:uncharacterized protein (DUF3820 family)